MFLYAAPNLQSYFSLNETQSDRSSTKNIACLATKELPWVNFQLYFLVLMLYFPPTVREAAPDGVPPSPDDLLLEVPEPEDQPDRHVDHGKTCR